MLDSTVGLFSSFSRRSSGAFSALEITGKVAAECRLDLPILDSGTLSIDARDPHQSR